MPNRAAIILADGQTTPVNHTFNPDGSDGELSTFQDTSTGIPTSYWKYSLRYQKPSAKQKEPLYRVTATLMVPVMAVTAPASGTGIQPAPEVAYYCSSSTTYFLPARSELQPRKDIFALTKNLHADPNFKTIVTMVENYWS